MLITRRRLLRGLAASLVALNVHLGSLTPERNRWRSSQDLTPRHGPRPDRRMLTQASVDHLEKHLDGMELPDVATVIVDPDPEHWEFWDSQQVT